MEKEQFLRNIGTLTVEEQVKINNTRVGIAGCGLGSEVARQLARFGFDITALADPDTVEIHNLNRQHYHHSHIGISKVEALVENLQLINPELKPHLFKEGITEKNYKDFVDKADIIIDGIDPTSFHLSLAVTREAHRQKKAVVTALDMGFGARLFVFPPDGIDIMEFMKLDPHITDAEIMKMDLYALMDSYIQNIPQYTIDIMLAFEKGELSYYPQNMLAVAQSGVMVTAACKRLALGQPVKSAPHYLHIDVDLELSQTS